MLDFFYLELYNGRKRCLEGNGRMFRRTRKAEQNNDGKEERRITKENDKEKIICVIHTITGTHNIDASPVIPDLGIAQEFFLKFSHRIFEIDSNLKFAVLNKSTLKRVAFLLNDFSKKNYNGKFVFYTEEEYENFKENN